MLAKCANPICGAHFRYLNQGHVYNVPIYGTEEKGGRGPQRIEHYWVCAKCSETLTLVLRNGEPEVRERRALLTDGGVNAPTAFPGAKSEPSAA